MSMIAGASKDEKREFSQTVKMMTAAAPPPATVIAAMEDMGIEVTHAYGLTEVYGPAVVCAEKPGWDDLPLGERAAVIGRISNAMGYRRALQACIEGGPWVRVRNVPHNIVMKGYLKQPEATAKSFKDGWFWSGDIAVQHPDGYVEIRDRSKDIIISGGENISSIEVEKAVYSHPAVSLVAVVAMPDEKWGEVPCAFVELVAGAEASEADILEHARARLAGYQRPKKVIFEELPKTTTGKVKKNELRDRLKALGTGNG